MRDKIKFRPTWLDKPPLEGSYRSIFKWADPTGFKHPNDRLYAMIRDNLGMCDDDFVTPKNHGNEKVVCDHPIRLSKKQIKEFINIVGRENIATDSFSRVKFTHGQAVEETLQLRNQVVNEVSDLIIHPRNKEDIRHIVCLCNQENIPIYVYGGGSSATLGLRPVKGGITLVMNTHMNKILSLNEADQTVCVQPGMMGPDYENMLNHAPKTLSAKRRYTGGHFPQSFEGSSVEGWKIGRAHV